MGLVWYGLDGMKGVCSKGNGLEGQTNHPKTIIPLIKGIIGCLTAMIAV